MKTSVTAAQKEDNTSQDLRQGLICWLLGIPALCIYLTYGHNANKRFLRCKIPAAYMTNLKGVELGQAKVAPVCKQKRNMLGESAVSKGTIRKWFQSNIMDQPSGCLLKPV